MERIKTLWEQGKINEQLAHWHAGFETAYSVYLQLRTLFSGCFLHL
jgi:hypothetical protein